MTEPETVELNPAPVEPVTEVTCTVQIVMMADGFVNVRADTKDDLSIFHSLGQAAILFVQEMRKKPLPTPKEDDNG